MKDKSTDIKARRSFKRFRSDERSRSHDTQQQTPDEQLTKTKTLLVGSLLVIGICLVTLAGVHVDHFIYSYPEFGRRLTTTSSSDSITTTLHLDERYAFDGTHSDFAQQFYRRYLAGDQAAKITDTSDLTEVVDFVSKEFDLDFDELPAMLQQAIVWDMGYVAAADLGYVKVYTKCGMRMSELQISRSAYKSAGCTDQRCASPNGELFYQSLYCSGYQMGNVSLCAATNGITPVHGSMWSNGGTDDVVPVSEMQRHEWSDADTDYTIMAIHLVGDPNSYGKCLMPSMTIPCVVYDASSTDEVDWCSPEHGEVVPQWLELEKNGGVLVAESSGWQKAALPITITSLVLLVLVVVGVFIFWWKTREKQQRNEDLLEQKRAILGGRDADELSMVDDIDFILEAPGRSFIETGAKEQTVPAWVAWGQAPIKSKQTIKRSVGGESSEDLDAMLLRGSFDDIKAIDSIYRNEDCVDDHFHHSFRSPSKATTAGLTSFASGVTGSPRNTLTLTFTQKTSSTERAPSSSVSTDPTSATMISPLVEFQNDPAVVSRRVPFIDVRLVTQITAGAYGEVWLGRMRGDIVAVKRLPRDRRHQLHELEVFAAEIQLMASFSHLNVLELLGVAWNTLENMLLIMEYMERGDLQHVLQYHSDQAAHVHNVSDKEFSWASHKARIARDIACGLKYLHTRQPIVVLRDLKSKNVLIDNNYEAKLSDFGVSRNKETMTSEVGTAYWTAPEVLAGHKYSEKADVYSLGVVLTELDTGELPFFDARTSDGDKIEAIHILSLVVSGELQPSFTLECPDDIRKLALACLNPMPDCRPSSMEVMNELNRLLESNDRGSLPSGGFV